jgi:hypothetical protein
VPRRGDVIVVNAKYEFSAKTPKKSSIGSFTHQNSETYT